MVLLGHALAGGLGAVTRAGVDEWLTRKHPGWLATLTINVIGSFLLGLVSQLTIGEIAVAVGIGFHGGFTTFSTSCWQIAKEISQ